MRDIFSIQGLCFSFYNSLTLLFSEIEGRFYGGGVLELTPSEFKGLPICYGEPTSQEFNHFENAFPSSRAVSEPDFSYGDNWIRHRLQMSTSDMVRIQNALEIVRSHRVRHGQSS